jgi:large subunit ribosomal protein L18
MAKTVTPFERRRMRMRTKLREINRAGLPRLSIHRTGKQIYAQIIDDVQQITLAAASTLDTDLGEKLKSGSNIPAAEAVGKLIASRAKKAGVSKVQFDRGGYLYHGRVKALAEGAREGGLEF